MVENLIGVHGGMDVVSGQLSVVRGPSKKRLGTRDILKYEV